MGKDTDVLKAEVELRNFGGGGSIYINGETIGDSMKTLKSLTCAIATAALLAFCATSAKAFPIIGMVTNFSTVTISLTLTTSTVRTSTTSGRSTLQTDKLVNKDILRLLTNSDFAGFRFPSGSRLVVDWDTNQFAGHILVIDSSTNAIYDATAGTASNSLVIDFYHQIGAASYTRSFTGRGNLNLTGLNNASFMLTDGGSQSIDLAATGPCTDRFTNKNFVSGIESWTDSQKFTPNGAGGTYGALTGITISGTITATGKGSATPVFQNLVYFPPPRPPV